MGSLFEQVGDSIAESTPRVLLALAIVLAGWVAARLLSKGVFAVLARTSLDAWASRRLGIEGGRYGHRIERVLARVVFYALMVMVIILALDTLQLGMITRPMQAALTEVATELPNLLAGLVILIAGIAVAKFLGDMCRGLLVELGFDRFFATHFGWRTQPLPTDEPVAAEARRLPSRVVSRLVTAVVVLLVVWQVLDIVGLDRLALLVGRFVNDVLPDLGIAALVLLAGIWAGSWVKRTIDDMTASSARGPLPRVSGSIARVAVLTFAVAMALQQVGVAPELIAIAFAILFGSLCLALALAFGLGGREVAAEIVRDEYERRKEAASSIADES